MSPQVMTTADKVRLEKKRKLKHGAAEKSDRYENLTKGNNGKQEPATKPPKSKASTAGTSTETAPGPMRPPPGGLQASAPSSAAASESTAAGKKRKRPSPFRIKVGCVVALRYRDKLVPHITLVRTINNEDDGPTNASVAEAPSVQALDWASLLHVWTAPTPGRDEGLALLGKRVRCHLPQVVPHQTRRVLEGEIVRLPDWDPFHGAKLGPGRPTKVELLIDEGQLTHFPFLKRIAEVDPATLTTSVAQRHHRLEEQIRGPNTALVLLKLASPVTMAVSSTGSTKDGKTGSTDYAAVSRTGVTWAMLKLVPANLFWRKTSTKRGSLTSGSQLHHSSASDSNLADPTVAENTTTAREEPSVADVNGSASIVTPVGEAVAGVATPPIEVPPAPSTTQIEGGVTKAAPSKSGSKRKKVSSSRHVGDGNDSPEQQIQNWRWLSGRYHDFLLASSLSTTRLDHSWEAILSGGFVGHVIKVDPCSDGSSLARVTLRRLVLPEHTVSGRLPHHGLLDLFEDSDTVQSSKHWSIEVPIEHLVIAGRKLSQRSTSNDEFNDSLSSIATSLETMEASYSYSFRNDSYRPLIAKGTNNANLVIQGGTCHRCRRIFSSTELLQCSSRHCPVAGLGATSATAWCKACCRQVSDSDMQGRMEDEQAELDLPCCLGKCDCRSCTSFLGSDLCDDLTIAVTEASRAASITTSKSESTIPIVERTIATVRSLEDFVDFGLPLDFLDLERLPKPQIQPFTRVKPRTPKRSGTTTVSTGIKVAQEPKESNGLSTKGGRKRPEADVPTTRPGQEAASEDYSVFQPTSARIKAISEFQEYGPGFTASSFTDVPRNVRLAMSHKQKALEKYDKVSSRSTRADQRRFMKEVAAIGTTWLGLDTLASREPQLRFDRSGIHAWGVYADEDISAEEMIIEYRGELIENAMAEKREREYNLAKIGSDYMFRIDANLVCDATKQGNVARFINASCDPNCYTKIITLDGSKRIVIYAKRDLKCGEELCYDYKFPLEYDEAKRIPCHCGAKECRGFMNWVRAHTMFSGLLQCPDGSLSTDAFARRTEQTLHCLACVGASTADPGVPRRCRNRASQ